MSNQEPITTDDILATANQLRWEIGADFHEKLMETLYGEAARIADKAVTHPGEKPRFDLDRTIDRLVTSRLWGFPLMILLFTIVFWITITGANYMCPEYLINVQPCPASLPPGHLCQVRLTSLPVIRSSVFGYSILKTIMNFKILF